MHRLALALSFLLLFNFSTKAENTKTNNDDATAVRAAITNYIEGYFSGDAQRMQQTLHPHYLKHIIQRSGPMRERTGAQIMTDVRKEGTPELPAAQKTEQVTVLDIAGDIASAKLVTPGWTDYMTLSKVNGDWKIL